ncbi:hypothetical protein [Methylomagnum sp.]
MKVAEFIAEAHDGIVELPSGCQAWNGKKVRVVLLEPEGESARQEPEFKAVSITTKNYRFDREAANAR